jgi:hypothetical protein
MCEIRYCAVGGAFSRPVIVGGRSLKSYFPTVDGLLTACCPSGNYEGSSTTKVKLTGKATVLDVVLENITPQPQHTLILTDVSLFIEIAFAPNVRRHHRYFAVELLGAN